MKQTQKWIALLLLVSSVGWMIPILSALLHGDVHARSATLLSAFNGPLLCGLLWMLTALLLLLQRWRLAWATLLLLSIALLLRWWHYREQLPPFGRSRFHPEGTGSLVMDIWQQQHFALLMVNVSVLVLLGCARRLSAEPQQP